MSADLFGSLFSGIGGLELGLELAGLGRVAWQVEQDERCRRVLAKHWPAADRSVVDVRAAGAATLLPVRGICGGFPCQDVSGAGKGAGLGGARSGLWWEFARCVAELRPEWAVVENVTSGARRWVPAVRHALHELGYCTVDCPIRASDLGAPHRRARIFVVAYRNGIGRAEGPSGTGPERAGRAELGRGGRPVADADRHRKLEPHGDLREVEQRSGDGGEALADPDRLDVRLEPGRGRRARRGDSPLAGDGGEALADPDRQRREARSDSARLAHREAEGPTKRWLDAVEALEEARTFTGYELGRRIPLYEEPLLVLDRALWLAYAALYEAEMRVSFGLGVRAPSWGPLEALAWNRGVREDAAAWRWLLGRERVVLTCYCRDRERCHRGVLAGILVRLGFVDGGELVTAAGGSAS